MDKIEVEQISDREVKISFPGGINCTSQKTKELPKQGSNMQVEKLSNKELKITLPEGVTCEVDQMSIQEFYNALTFALVPYNKTKEARCFLEINF